MDQEIELYGTELQAYTEDSVKKLVYLMFDRRAARKQIVDYASIQYKYLEIWGIIDLDEWKAHIKQAEKIDRAEVNCQMRFLKPLDKAANIEAIAKLIAVKALYDQLINQGVHISTCFNL